MIRNKLEIAIVVFFCLLLSVVSRMHAQISEGGIPISFDLNVEFPTIKMPRINADSIIQEELELDRKCLDRPFRFGCAIDVNIDLKQAGIQKQLPNGDKLWLLRIHSEGAYSINLMYNQFRLSNGSKLFIYNENRTMILGAFTPEVSNNPYNEFATDLVQGNSIILEYYEPKSSDYGIINISKVIHGYVNTFSNYSSGYGTSAICNIDVNCSLGNYWESEKRAVSMILVNENTAFCTGCLVNNVERNHIPYYLTANHCLSGNTNTWIFRFKYWRPNCNSGNPSNWVSVTGATLRASYTATDFALLELNTVPPESYDLYYAGWDRTSIPAENATAIHHPRGDAMKISYDANPVIAVSWNAGNQNHWRTIFDQGIVQHGSSGSPLFNQLHRVIGQLHGNQNNQCEFSDNTCHCTQTPVGEYGRFDLSWTGGGTNSSRLSNWLDPNNTGVTVLDGISSCHSTTVTGQRDNETIRCRTINVQDAVIPTGKTVILEGGSTRIFPRTVIESGSKFVITR